MKIPVFVSSKQKELADERRILEVLIEDVGMQPVLAEAWTPERSSIHDVYTQKVLECPIYCGVFYREYSSATEKEYRLAKSHPHREMICYVRRAANKSRDPELVRLIDQIREEHVHFAYDQPYDLFPIAKEHLRDAVGRMIQLLMRLKVAHGRTSRASQQEGFGGSQEFLKALGFREGRFDTEMIDSMLESAHATIERLGKVNELRMKP